MYQLYIANKNYSSWSLRPWVLMRALDIPFAEKLNRFLTGSSWGAFRKFSPTGRVPALHDGKTVVWDSLGIAQYLGDRHASVWPTDPAARAWAQCAASEMHSSFGTLRNVCSMSVGMRVRLNELTMQLNEDITRLSELWNEGFERFGGPFLAGKAFTAADAFFAPVAFRIQTYGLKLDGNSNAYAQRLLDLPAMRAWYEAGIAETFRDAEHDAEVTKYGKVVEDLRAKAVL